LEDWEKRRMRRRISRRKNTFIIFIFTNHIYYCFAIIGHATGGTHRNRRTQETIYKIEEPSQKHPGMFFLFKLKKLK
jgi:hypothetical protein